MADGLDEPGYSISAGLAAAPLIARPQDWINRRVETIQILSHEETRRQVSVDFTLSAEKRSELVTEHGVVVPISVMTKEARRNFDLRDESGGAVPVLGKNSNGAIAHAALMGDVFDAIPGGPDQDEFDLAWGHLEDIVVAEPSKAADALSNFVGSAEAGETLPGIVWANSTCRAMLEVLQDNYVLFAVLSPDTADRRVLKYSFGEDFDLAVTGTVGERLLPSALFDRVWTPGRRQFQLLCPGAWRAMSFHLEVVIPEELRIETAFLYDFSEEKLLSRADRNRNRASLYANQPVGSDLSVDAYVVIASERRGAATQSAITGVVVTALIWLGVAAGLQFKNPDASVSIVVAGAALYSGMTATKGESSLVSRIFSTPRFLLAWVSLSALAASATLAMEFPSARPTTIWLIAAVVASVASACLVWSAIRAPG